MDPIAARAGETFPPNGRVLVDKGNCAPTPWALRQKSIGRAEEEFMRKRSIAVFLALVLSAGMAFAAQRPQGKMGKMGKRGMPTVEQQVSRMKTNLNLTDEQSARVKELFEKQRGQMETWRKDNPKPTPTAMRTHREQMMKERTEGLKKILTPEQFKKHEEMMRRGMKRGPKGPPKG